MGGGEIMSFTSHLWLTVGAVFGFFLFNLISLLLGFWLGRMTKAYPVVTSNNHNTKEEKPFVEDITEDPWETALKEPIDKKVKIVGSL